MDSWQQLSRELPGLQPQTGLPDWSAFLWGFLLLGLSSYHVLCISSVQTAIVLYPASNNVSQCSKSPFFYTYICSIGSDSLKNPG
jgi:hypothetical protein